MAVALDACGNRGILRDGGLLVWCFGPAVNWSKLIKIRPICVVLSRPAPLILETMETQCSSGHAVVGEL